MPDSLTISTSTSEQALIVSLAGEVSLDTMDQLGRELLAINARRAQLLVFDFSGLTFIASLGLGMLMECHRSAHRRGGQVRFAAMQPMVLDIIKRCRLDSVLSIHGSVDQALAVSPMS